MTDTEELVRRLYNPVKFGAAADYATMREAADTIERLTAPRTDGDLVTMPRDVIKPFLDYGRTLQGQRVRGDDILVELWDHKITVDDFRNLSMLAVAPPSKPVDAPSKPVDAPSPTDDEEVMREILATALETEHMPLCAGTVRGGDIYDPTALAALKAMSTYAARVRADERERCAKIADAEADRHNTESGFDSQPAYSTAFKIAAAIRTGDK